MNQFNHESSQFYYPHHLHHPHLHLNRHLTQFEHSISSSSSLSQRLFATKLARAMTNGNVMTTDSSSSSPSPSSSSSTTNNDSSIVGHHHRYPDSSTNFIQHQTQQYPSMSNSILYSAILSPTPFAIPATPPLISDSYYRTRINNNNSMTKCRQQQQQQKSSNIDYSDGAVSTTTGLTLTTDATITNRLRNSNGINCHSSIDSGRNYHHGSRHRQTGNHQYNHSSRHTDSEVASVSAAHQNESHNSLAATMPLLSSYLRNGTINGYGSNSNRYNHHHNQKNNSQQMINHVNCTTNNVHAGNVQHDLKSTLKVKMLPKRVADINRRRSATNDGDDTNHSNIDNVVVVDDDDVMVVMKKNENVDELVDGDVDAVRFGRVPKREKAKILAAMQKVNAHSTDKALTLLLEDEHNISATIAKAHDETCDYTREKVAPLLDAARSRPIYAQCPPQMTCPLNPLPVGAMDSTNATARILEDFSERFSPAIRGVVEFAKRIPGFSMLSQEDQVTLLKAGVFEVLLVRLACMFDSHSSSMVCLNGLVLRRDALHSASNARFLLDSMFDFAERLNQLRLSDHEIGLFCAVVVIAPDRPGIRNIDLVEKINKRLEEVLQKAIASNHPNDVANGKLIFNELTKKIPDLRTLNTLHSEKLLGKSFGMGLESSTTPIHHHQPQQQQHMDSTTGGMQCPMQSAAANLIVQQTQSAQQSIQQVQPDSSDNSPSDRWSSSSSLGHFSPATSTEDRSVSPTSGPWNEHHSKDGGFGSPRSMSSSSGISSDDSHSRKGSISLSSAPPKLAYINSYVRGLSSSMVINNNNISQEQLISASTIDEYNQHHQQQQQQQQQQSMISPYSMKSSRVESPITDSGILMDHQQHQQPGTPATSSSSSICSSPSRSAMEEAAKKLLLVASSVATSPRSVHSDSTESSDKLESIDDMPVLKRALQAPPLVNTNKLMDEAYRHHKKFRAARRDTEPHSPSTTTGISPVVTLNNGSSSSSSSSSTLTGLSTNIDTNSNTTTSSALSAALLSSNSSSSSSTTSSTISSSSLASTHSTLLKTLEQPSRYLSEQQLKRTDLIHNIIMSTEAVTGTALPAPIIANTQPIHSFATITSPKISIENHTQSPYYHQNGVMSSTSSSSSLVCPFTGRTASNINGQSVNINIGGPQHHGGHIHGHHQHHQTQQYGPYNSRKSPEPGVAAAAAGLLVIGSSFPPSPPSSTASSTAAAYSSHLQRCLTANTAPIGLIGSQSLLPPTTATIGHHHTNNINDDDDEEDAQPLNLSKKPASPSIDATTSSSSSAIKMEID